jgi:hypothetical protein
METFLVNEAERSEVISASITSVDNAEENRQSAEH